MDKLFPEFKRELDELNKELIILKTATNMKERDDKFIELIVFAMNRRMNRLCSMLTNFTDNNSYKQ